MAASPPYHFFALLKQAKNLFHFSEKTQPSETAHKECLNVRMEGRVSNFSAKSKILVYIEIVNVIMLSVLTYFSYLTMPLPTPLLSPESRS